MRNGRFSARVARVDLVAAGQAAHDGRIHLAATGIDEEIVIDVSTCTLAPRGTKRSCTCRTCPLPTLVADALDGTYTVHGPEFLGAALAQLSTPDIGLRRLRLLASVFDEALLEVSPSFDLDGSAIVEGDILLPIVGSATVVVPSGSRVVGAVESQGVGPFRVSWPFVMERPAVGTPRALGGAWRIELRRHDVALVGILPLAIEVAADGVAIPGPWAPDDAPEGVDAYEVRGGDCLAAPEGQLFCQLLVEATKRVSLLRLQGKLDLVEETGQGEFYIGYPPNVTFQGVWTATRP